MRLELLSTDGAFLIPLAKQRLANLDAQRQTFGLSRLQKIFSVNGFTVTIIAVDGSGTIRIEGEEIATGFICHPRSDASKGGWKEDGSKLAGEPVYPLIDDDGGSRVVTREDAAWVQNYNAENYGNIDWKGLNTSASDELSNVPVLSWRGPPSRHFALAPTTQIAGLTGADETVTSYVDGMPVDTNYYTPFGPNVYEAGAILATLPAIGSTTPKVLGAAYNGNTLVVIAGTNYRGMINPELKGGGFYYEAWAFADDKWQRLGFMQSSRQTVPFFFNSSGTEAQTVEPTRRIKVTIDPAVGRVIFSESATGSGAITEAQVKTGSGQTFTTQRTGRYVVAVDYIGDTEVLAYATIKGSDSSTLTGDETSAVSNNVPYAFYGTQPVRTIHIDNNAGIYSVIEDTPGACPYTITWAIADTSFVLTVTNNTATLSHPGPFPCSVTQLYTELTATTVGPDGGQSAKYFVLDSVNSATWVYESGPIQNNYSGCGSIWGECISCETIIGDIKYIEHVIILENFPPPGWPCTGGIIEPKCPCATPLPAYHVRHQFGVTIYRWRCP